MRLRPFFPLVLILVIGALAATVSSAQSPQPVPTQISGRDAIMVGTAWYPEQWPETRWEGDLRLMEAANIKMVRIAEFAWSTMEPTEGHYEMDWLERAIAAAAKHHIASVVGTPTAAPPAWLTQKHPEVLRIDERGQRVTHGNRAHGSSTSPVYREYCRKIAEEMAKRFGHNPNMIGWQIDNEYGYALMSHDGLTRKQFQDWLRRKYKTLEALNSFWTTAYWSETYDNWSEIPIPVGGHNPGLRLEWKRFVTDTWNDYQMNQISMIRKYAEPRQFITGNFMGFFDGFDHYVMSAPLTFASWDDYVGSGHVDPDHNGLTHDLTRGFKRENFWVIETQPGAVNWHDVNNFLNRGEARAMAWQAIAHGADLVSYWQWRSALNGQEQYHGTLLGADGTPLPFYQEAGQLGLEFSKVQEAFRGTTNQSEAALLYSYDSHWAIQFQKHTQKYDDIGLLRNYYHALRKLTPSLDVISGYAPLDGYKLVVAPSFNVLPKDLANHLLDYVRKGGHLVLGPRSGMKEEHNELQTQRQPGYLAEALGARVEQYYALEKDFDVFGEWGNGQASVWAEQLALQNPGEQMLLRYGNSNGWLDGQPAAVTHAYGKGRVTYIGAILDNKLMSAAAEWMAKQSGLRPMPLSVPEGVELSLRSGGGKRVMVLINFAQEQKKIDLGKNRKLLLSGGEADTVRLAPYGVEVVEGLD